MRFINCGSAGLSDGVNVYAYVGGNPIMLVDPSGLGGQCGGGGGVVLECRLQEIQFNEAVELAAEHTNNERPSTKEKHENANARRDRDAGGEKADKKRRYPSKRPKGPDGKPVKGKWPPVRSGPPVIILPEWIEHQIDPCIDKPVICEIT